ncbi:MAG: glycosyltransferase family 2 protein [Bacteroidetes bacterium]|nr:glycosyltransferase family 2 protein [Bacteroidota bacterium]
MNCPVFSLVIPTLNRSDELNCLLRSLQNQSFKDFEVIVVDQNQDERLTPIVERFASDLNIKRIKQTERGASRARNAGLRESSGQFVTFPDDDCEYPANLLERVHLEFNRLPALSGITTSSRDKNSTESVARFSSKRGRINKYNILQRTVEATIFVRASAIKDFFFDEDMGVGASTPWWSDEGPDFVLRLINKGAQFSYYPEIVIYHPNPVHTYDENAIIRSYRYGLGRGKYLQKHNYPMWYVLYVWSLYLAGILIGCVQFNTGKIKYYYSGLKGRVQGYLKSKNENSI